MATEATNGITVAWQWKQESARRRTSAGRDLEPMEVNSADFCLNKSITSMPYWFRKSVCTMQFAYCESMKPVDVSALRRSRSLHQGEKIILTSWLHAKVI